MKYIFKSTKNCKINHLPILGHGHQGTVFKKGNSAVKLLSLGSARPNDSDGRVAIKISNINLQAFVRPYNFVFKKGKLSSFNMELLHLDKGKKIVDMDIEAVIRSLKKIREDVGALSDNCIKINDLQMHNIGISGEDIRVFDFSDYSFSDDSNLYKLNNSEVDSLFGSVCIMQELDDVNSISIYDHVYSDYLRSGFSTIEEYFEDKVLGQYDNISQYVRQKVKTNVLHK